MKLHSYVRLRSKEDAQNKLHYKAKSSQNLFRTSELSLQGEENREHAKR